MKTLSSDTVPKLAPNLTGGGNSPQLVDNSTDPLTWVAVCGFSCDNQP